MSYRQAIIVVLFGLKLNDNWDDEGRASLDGVTVHLFVGCPLPHPHSFLAEIKVFSVLAKYNCWKPSNQRTIFRPSFGFWWHRCIYDAIIFGASQSWHLGHETIPSVDITAFWVGGCTSTKQYHAIVTVAFLRVVVIVSWCATIDCPSFEGDADL